MGRFSRRRVSRPARRLIGRRPGGFEALEARRLLAVDVIAPLADISISTGAAGETINLADVFDLSDVTGTVVRFDTNVSGGSSFFAELFDQPGPDRARTTPETVANFLDYVDGDLYTDTIIHRSVPGFVVQGGGFEVPAATGELPSSVATFPPVVNEAGNTNTRGMLAMAKLGGDANSATSQYFVNLGDNSANLDFQNGGFTAFARVLGDGMTVVDAMAALPTTNLGGAFTDLPVIGTDGTGDLAPENYVTITSVTQVGELVYTVLSSDPSVASATVSPTGELRLDYAASAAGVATVTVRAASVFDAGDYAEEQFLVTVSSPDLAAPPVIVAGAEAGSLPWVTVLDATTGATISQFLAFHPNNRGGVSVALGDVDGDGIDEVIAASGAGTRSVVKFFELDGSHLAAYRTLPYASSYRGGLAVAAGDFDGNGIADLAVVSAQGAGRAEIFFIDPSAADPVPNQAAVVITRIFPGSIGGTTLAAADVGSFAGGAVVDAAVADGRDELAIGSGIGVRSEVRVYDVSTPSAILLRTLRPLDAGYLGGLNVSSGRYDADQLDDIIVSGGRRSGSVVEVYSGRVTSTERLLRQAAFASLADQPTVTAALDTDGDGRINSIVAGQGGGAGTGIRLLAGTDALNAAFSSLSGSFHVAATRRAALEPGG